jgi:hypothetical protein
MHDEKQVYRVGVVLPSASASPASSRISQRGNVIGGLCLNRQGSAFNSIQQADHLPILASGYLQLIRSCYLVAFNPPEQWLIAQADPAYSTGTNVDLKPLTGSMKEYALELWLILSFPVRI